MIDRHNGSTTQDDKFNLIDCLHVLVCICATYSMHKKKDTACTRDDILSNVKPNLIASWRRTVTTISAVDTYVGCVHMTSSPF